MLRTLRRRRRRWSRTTFTSGRKLCGNEYIFLHLHLQYNVIIFSLPITEASKCMPQTSIERETSRLSSIQKWETCRDICNKDETCDSFNHWVHQKKGQNFQTKAAFPLIYSES